MPKCPKCKKEIHFLLVEKIERAKARIGYNEELYFFDFQKDFIKDIELIFKCPFCLYALTNAERKE